ncbi:hypothetical protein PHYBLDRAFT_166323 [Phycomyces blakesleeanus NRRL 1555(-)]|uniref:Uncharacterized protein n=1 Tax=Phycomyces blakesleeanus (strain ATCC 8743b / DSM 1359 / FGSC 10004 / NBRC 33097 / NRRL 1555) TaxID=763407 RepID=A0A163AWZ3_PHYB8|nr:hypothetical protein PHYBLDRAFT_166323 [Phycomyces blakesleeanus NRRL 1555(-)]OAD76351.1 hypothetical protein PHYBLDRAFT_166323 [Phycomyces blakesleeanus NRRL 1555(-)]|eukprot:XP_018294391.1 hypothetical protein PHYBLDRAFT_166323 [Phycomyces blakesleeanus NRRL 1555(-)]
MAQLKYKKFKLYKPLSFTLFLTYSPISIGTFESTEKTSIVYLILCELEYKERNYSVPGPYYQAVPISSHIETKVFFAEIFLLLIDLNNTFYHVAGRIKRDMLQAPPPSVPFIQILEIGSVTNLYSENFAPAPHNRYHGLIRGLGIIYPLSKYKPFILSAIMSNVQASPQPIPVLLHSSTKFCGIEIFEMSWTSDTSLTNQDNTGEIISMANEEGEYKFSNLGIARHPPRYPLGRCFVSIVKKRCQWKKVLVSKKKLKCDPTKLPIIVFSTGMKSKDAVEFKENCVGIVGFFYGALKNRQKGGDLLVVDVNEFQTFQHISSETQTDVIAQMDSHTDKYGTPKDQKTNNNKQ